MPIPLWLSLVAICAMGAMSPGPSLAMVLRHTLSGGRVAGVVAGSTHALGVGLYALLTVLGLGALMARFPILFQVVSWLGAGYLGWLGLSALRAATSDSLSPAPAITTQRQAARDGILVALANPKLVIFFVALLSQFVTAETGLLAKVIIVATAMGIDGAWYLLVAVLLSHSRVLPWLQTHAHWINRITGGLLLALALRVLMGAFTPG